MSPISEPEGLFRLLEVKVGRGLSREENKARLSSSSSISKELSVNCFKAIKLDRIC